MSLSPGTRLGPYEICAQLGAGGMGEVYEATDTRLGRTVAIKVLPERLAREPDLRDRFEREARTISSLNHPHICTLYDVGHEVPLSSAGRQSEGSAIDFLVMEHLEGETLANQLARERLTVPEAGHYVLTLLGTLEALQHRDLIHRDLKPANLFVTPHGLKLLDFGLARSVETDPDETAGVTAPGTLAGTPQYMAPEALTGQPVDARADLFAVGAILYEMLAGRPAFAGRSVIEVAHAVIHDTPALLTGSTAVTAIDRIVHRALAKQPDARYPSAGAMAQALRQVLATTSDTQETMRARPVSRLVVLPFQMLRPDDDTEYLAFSLPDAITSSLSGLRSLVVRSSRAAGKFDSATPDLKALAEQAEVDLVLLGTLLRAGDQLRVKAQLLEVPSGTVLWSHSAQATLRDLFQLEDDLTRRIVESLSQPLTTGEHQQLGRDAPASATAYEFYLRANQLSQDPEQCSIARDLYQRCLEADPEYAPAWARLGRVHRVLAKYFDLELPDRYADGLTHAESAFERALTLNPDLTIAHNQYTALEVERGRAQGAMVRLLERAKTRGADPELFAGLVTACRYCGLSDASVAAHEHARRLDPTVPSSVVYTLSNAGDYTAAVELATGSYNFGVRTQCLIVLGRRTEALDVLKRRETDIGSQRAPIVRLLLPLLRTLAEGGRDRDVAALEARFDMLMAVDWDPEGTFRFGLYLAQAGGLERAVALIDRAITRGYACYPALVRDPWLDALRGRPDFGRMLKAAKTRHDEAREAFRRASGEEVLGVEV